MSDPKKDAGLAGKKPETGAKAVKGAKAGGRKPSAGGAKKAPPSMPLPVITDNKDAVVKVIFALDRIGEAFGDSISEIISHPQGNVDDASQWPEWSRRVAERLAAKLVVARQFVSVGFHTTDERGQDFEDSNWVRVTASVAGDTRHRLLVDPTPED